MRFQDLQDKLRDYPIFTVHDIRKVAPDFHRPRLNEWQEKGYIKKLRRGYYIFADVSLSEASLFLIANRLYTPSYVSLEMALSWYGLIPESVYTVTSVTSKKTGSFQTPIAHFSYRSVKSELMFGYQLESIRNQKYKLAEAEKAVLDYLYLNPHVCDEAAFAGLRFNRESFLEKIDQEKLFTYGEQFANAQLLKRVRGLVTFIHT